MARSRARAEEKVARLLLVDDVRKFVEVLKTYLKRTTCRILTARNGPDAIQTCRRETPDVVFLDAAMREGSGVELCKTLKADPVLRAVPVVIITSRDRTDECLQAGCDEVMTKPVAQEDFLAMVRQFVALRERAEDRMPVSLRVEFHAASGVYTAYTKDLSPHGVFVKSPRPFSVGTRMSLTIHLPKGRPALTLDAEVKRVVEPAPGGHLLPGIGLRFVEVPPDALRILEEFIAERAAR